MKEPTSAVHITVNPKLCTIIRPSSVQDLQLSVIMAEAIAELAQLAAIAYAAYQVGQAKNEWNEKKAEIKTALAKMNRIYDNMPDHRK